MSSITVREKEHWKNRINQKIEQAVENLLVTTNPTYRETIKAQARQLALDSLGIRTLDEQLQELSRQESEAKQEQVQVQRRMMETACGVQADGEDCSTYLVKNRVANAIDRRQAHHEKELMTEDELGLKLLELDREKDELLDTVWLATSGKQVKQLWQRVGELLKLSPTPLQQKALEIDPFQSE